MPWLVLVLSAVLEAVWATALSESAGLTVPVPTVVFLVATILSVVGLGWAMKSIPTGTAYAAWTGIGAVLTVTWAAVTGAEPLSPLKVLFLAGIIACVVGLKFSTPSGLTVPVEK
ncbi:MAG TPA: multidrug efflux SMR transporter [Propionibacterium sp.]|nr:multidrug efflux SMR transporter [Propionibacterium sp.]